MSMKMISQWDNESNEDYVYSNDTFSFVIDGSTGLQHTIQVFPESSNARWYTQALGNALKKSLHKQKPIADIISDTNENLKEVYAAKLSSMGGSIGTLEKHELPTASISVLRQCNGYLEYFQLGDCITVIRCLDGTVEVWKDESVGYLDNMAIDHLSKISEKANQPPRNCLKEISGILIKNRSKYNTDSGYWVLDLFGTGISHATQKKIRMDQLYSFAVMSDGFADIVTKVSLFDNFSDLIDAMERMALEQLVEQLYTRLNNDMLFEKYPRLKQKDDASAVWRLVCPKPVQ